MENEFLFINVVGDCVWKILMEHEPTNLSLMGSIFIIGKFQEIGKFPYRPGGLTHRRV